MMDIKNELDSSNKTKSALLARLLNKKNYILKKYRGKFEELKISKLKSGLSDSKNTHE